MFVGTQKNVHKISYDMRNVKTKGITINEIFVCSFPFFRLEYTNQPVEINCSI